MNKFIQNYIQKITTSEINDFAIKNGIVLNNQELNIIYYHIKNNYQILLYKDPVEIFKDLKLNLQSNNYQKLERLYYDFKNRYSNFLRH